MHIREIVMDGFKCYSNKTTLKNIDRSFTAITGMNGSGKSNIIDAIIFALDLSSSRFMRVASLKELINIHRKDCTVTIVLDNSEKSRSPAGFENYGQVEISRSLDSEGKSKYRMNGHSCTKNTVENLCKSIGITNDFIVMQGHITKILSMKSAELKNMIEETSGTRSYSIEREKSFELLEKKEHKLKEAQEHLKKTISPFFSQLKNEKAIYEENRELEQNRKKNMEELERKESLYAKNEFFTKVSELASYLGSYAEDSAELKSIIQKLKEIDGFEEIDSFGIKEKINAEKNKIEEIMLQMADRGKLEDKKKEMRRMEGLSKELKYNKKELVEREEILSKELTSGSMNKIEELEKIRREMRQKEILADLNESKTKKIEEELQTLKNIDLAKILRHESDFLNEVKLKKEKLRKAAEECENMRNKIIYPILEGVYADESNTQRSYKDGVFGTVDENFEFLDPKYKEAILTILGARAKYVICRDDAVASEILKNCDRRVSCIPLNKIVVHPDRIKSGTGFIRAIESIKYDKKLDAAFEHIFNGFYIFEDKQNANTFCFSNKVMCVTLDGTVYDPKGTLTGGRTFYKYDVVRMSEILRREKEIRNLELEIPSNEIMMKIDEFLQGQKKRREFCEDISILKSKTELLEKLCGTQMNVSNLREELEKIRKCIVEAVKEEQVKAAHDARCLRVREEIRDYEENAAKNARSLDESQKKLFELQEELRRAEVKENNKRVSVRMAESLDFRKGILIKTTVKLKSKINKLYEEIVSSKMHSFGKNIVQEDKENIANTTGQKTEICRLYPVLEEFSFDKGIFEMKQETLDAEEKNRLEDEIRMLKERIATKRLLNTMDPSNFELLEKNSIDIQNLEEKINKLEKDKREIIRTIESLNEIGIKENRRAFEHINQNLRKFLSYFLLNSDIYITEGFEIKVKVGNWKNSLAELSGGQRSLIALCLIFSMLTFKPAPFYIFDEIDAALDLNYTQSIGEIIRKEFAGAQFIVVSLKNNMFDNANKIFKVVIQDHKSKICQIK